MDLTRLSVVVADDEPDVRNLVIRLLRTFGIERVSEAGNPDDALAVIDAGTSALLCDIQMPGGGATELLTRLSSTAFRPTVILMSGAGATALDDAAAAGTHLGFQIAGRLVKPVESTALGLALREVAGGRAAPESKLFRTPPASDRAIPLATVLQFSHKAAGPLMTVTLLAELLLEGGPLTTSQADDIRRIHAAARQLSDMLKDLEQLRDA